jgi:hypothetical protein
MELRFVMAIIISSKHPLAIDTPNILRTELHFDWS